MAYRTTVQCESCGSNIVPRMTFYNGRPTATFCPICGAIIQDFSPPLFKYIPVLIFVAMGIFLFMEY